MSEILITNICFLLNLISNVKSFFIYYILIIFKIWYVFKNKA